MNWLQSILYGFVMGFSEFVPVSSAAQARILHQLFGTADNDALRNLIIHIFSFTAFLFIWKKPLEIFAQAPQVRRRRGGTQNRLNINLLFLKATILPMLLCMLICFYFQGKPGIGGFILLMILGGIVLYLPSRMLQGNKTARSMTGLDTWLIGIAAGLGVIPGFSRIGMCIAAAQMRGADRKQAMNWAYILSVPALILLVGADLVTIVLGGGLVLSAGVLGYILMAVFAFAGSYLSVYFMRNIILHRGLSGFAYYAWGSALFVFILYLM